jgi:hypothetical protein
MFKIGHYYTQQKIPNVLGGGLQGYLSHLTVYHFW